MMTCSSASICYPATSATVGNKRGLLAGSVPTGVILSSLLWVSTQLRNRRSIARSNLDSNVFNMRTDAPKSLFPPESEHYRGPKLKVAIIGAGLAGMSTAVELLDQGHEVDIYESRSFLVVKWVLLLINVETTLKWDCMSSLTYDKTRNFVALALSPIVRAMVEPDEALREKRDLDWNRNVTSFVFSVVIIETFQNRNGTDFVFSQLASLIGFYGGTRMSIQRMWDPVAYALGFIDCDNIGARCLLTIFALFVTKTEASLLRTLKGSLLHLRWGCKEVLYDKFPDEETYVSGILTSKATVKKIVKADVYVAACDIPGIKRLVPQKWREWEFFDNIYKLFSTVFRQLIRAAGLDNLLCTPDADFSCFADLALASPEDYYLEGQGSLLQCVLTPGDPYMPLPNDEIINRVLKQVVTPVLALFPSSQGLEVTWSSVVKIDSHYTVKDLDYTDSMEGATLSGGKASAYIYDAGEKLVKLRKKITAVESNETTEVAITSDELSLR
ncbi:hypothetical protein ACH5RR_001215 [Cinchona calisaya]|uniref:Amine oxidase domain-containing protein n=1 Tax=Cinchona calisaya TaxID=153742 RepID=A0ABD3B324_9GENT